MNQGKIADRVDLRSPSPLLPVTVLAFQSKSSHLSTRPSLTRRQVLPESLLAGEFGFGECFPARHAFDPVSPLPNIIVLPVDSSDGST